MKTEILRLKENILKASFLAKEGHIPSAFSILDILYVLYKKVLKFSLKEELNLDRDYFILSKGQAALGLYVILAHFGFFKMEDLITNYCKYKSPYGGHPDRNLVRGVEASTGSLGHGFPYAVGIALGQKINKLNNRVYVLIGDGEANEGSIWESALLAKHHNLNNLCCIVDYNHSTDRALSLGNLKAKFLAFGWKVVQIDGHNHSEIYKALTNFSTKKPLLIIANTIKGKGCPLMENNPEWHHKAPSSNELKIIMNQLY